MGTDAWDQRLRDAKAGDEVVVAREGSSGWEWKTVPLDPDAADPDADACTRVDWAHHVGCPKTLAEGNFQGRRIKQGSPCAEDHMHPGACIPLWVDPPWHTPEIVAEDA